MPSLRPFAHRLLQRNYVGPGNAIDSAEVIDSIDNIAREHDIVYQAIEDSEVNLASVNAADTASASEFVNQGISELQSGSVSSGILGIFSGAALTAKATGERALGKPIYPAMPSGGRSHKRKPSTQNPLDDNPGKVARVSGHISGNLKRSQAKLERMIKAGAGPEELAEQAAIVERLGGEKRQFQGARDYHRAAADHRNLIAELSTIDDTPPPSRNSGEVGPDARGGAGHDQDFDIYEHVENTIDASTKRINDIVDYPDPVLESSLINQSDVEIAAAGLLNNFSVADNMSDVTQVIRSGGMRQEGDYLIFENSDIFYSWGYNIKALDIKDNETDTLKQKWLMTPLSYVPVDWLPFYLTPGEFEDLPREAMVEEVTCKVTPLGSRVSFQANGEEAQAATAQHVVIGAHAIGLNTCEEFNWANRDVTAHNSMVISEHTTISPSKLQKKLWGDQSSTMFDAIPSSFLVPRQLDIYGGPVVDPYVAPVGLVAEYKPPGWPHLNKVVSRFAFDASKGKPCTQYSYQPSYGMIKMKKRIAQVNKSDTGNAGFSVHGPYYANTISCGTVVKRTADANGNLTGVDPDQGRYNVNMTQNFIGESYNIYNTLIEKDRCRNWVSQLGQDIAVQPQLHIGILPVMANQPSDIATTFICAAAYWQIDRSIKIRVRFGTNFTHTVARPINRSQVFNEGYADDLYGMEGTVGGKTPFVRPYKS
jgi:hypothetical protein